MTRKGKVQQNLIKDEQVTRLFEELLNEKLNPLLAKINDLMLKHDTLQKSTTTFWENILSSKTASITNSHML